MKVKDIIKYITDSKIYVEIIDNNFASYGIYTIKEIKNSKYINKEIININIQYINNQRLLVIKIDM